MTTIRRGLGLLGWLGVTFLAGGLGAAATVSAPVFYAELVRPAWAPPAWLFGPVWSTLYLLMGIAAWQVWRTSGWSAARAALSLYVVQLILNATWSWLFFNARSGLFAFLEIIVLLVAIVTMVIVFRRHSVIAAVLLYPYLAWVSFATVLTYDVWQKNANGLLG